MIFEWDENKAKIIVNEAQIITKSSESFRLEKQTKRKSNNTGKGGHYEKQLRFYQCSKKSICKKIEENDLHKHQRISFRLFQKAFRENKHSIPNFNQHVSRTGQSRKDGAKIRLKTTTQKTSCIKN